MKSNIYAFTGAHGTGKTTSVYSTAANLKFTVKGEVGIIMETARQCPFPVFSKKEEPTEEAQMWIFCKQITSELEASKNYSRVISDRTCADAIAYSRLFGFDYLATCQIEIAAYHMPIYKSIRFKLIANNPYLKKDGLRSVDVSMQEAFEDTLIGVYNELRQKVDFC